jgi:hypothetical protein
MRKADVRIQLAENASNSTKCKSVIRERLQEAGKRLSRIVYVSALDAIDRRELTAGSFS